MVADLLRLSGFQADIAVRPDIRSRILRQRLRNHGKLRAWPYLRHLRPGEVRLLHSYDPRQTGTRALVVRTPRPLDASGGILRPGCEAFDRIHRRRIGAELFKLRLVRLHRRVLLGCGLHHSRLLSGRRMEPRGGESRQGQIPDNWPGSRSRHCMVCVSAEAVCEAVKESSGILEGQFKVMLAIRRTRQADSGKTRTLPKASGIPNIRSCAAPWPHLRPLP